MDTALPQKFPFILDRNLAKANCTGNRVCTSCDTVVLGLRQTNLRVFCLCRKMMFQIKGHNNELKRVILLTLYNSLQFIIV